MQSAGTNFIKIETKDMLLKMSRLASDKGEVNVWNKGEDSSNYKASASSLIDDESGNFVILKLFSEEDDSKFLNREIYLSFSVLNVDYFGEGYFEQFSGDEHLTIKLSSKIYRSEKRGSERLLTFPHHQVYAYFKIAEAKEEMSNVISMVDLKSKTKRDNKKGFDRISETGSIQAAELSMLESDEVVGFRVLDLANNGISFLADQIQKQFFINERLFDSFHLLFNGEAFTIKNGLLIYNVDYVRGKKGEDPIYKMGLKFETHGNLSDKLKDTLDESSFSQTTRNDFEEFVDE